MDNTRIVVDGETYFVDADDPFLFGHPRVQKAMANAIKERQAMAIQLSPDTEELVDEVQNNEHLYLVANACLTPDDFEREFAIIGHVNGLRDIDWDAMCRWWHS